MPIGLADPTLSVVRSNAAIDLPRANIRWLQLNFKEPLGQFEDAVCRNSMYETLANLLETVMAGSLFILLLTYFYMKYLLSRKGHKVNWFFDYGRTYREFAELVESEIDGNVSEKYMGILFILKASATTLVIATVSGVIFFELVR